MNRGFRNFISLLGIFIGTFVIVFLIRNGPEGLRTLISSNPQKNRSFRPEKYTLPEESPLNLTGIELLTRLNQEFAMLTEAVVDSVVSIDTRGVRAERLLDGYGRQFVRPVPTQGQGSGVIVTTEGHVITNHHVIKDQQQIQVTLNDGRTFPANLIGADALLDIAVLKIIGKGKFKPLKFGDSDQVRHGQLVFAIGNPFGLGETITQGIISARERSVSDTQRDLFQTDAAINPGNSGGPLINVKGDIVGINSAIYRPDQRVNSGFQGVGFSIPANDVKDALEAILQRGHPIRSYLGVRMGDLDHVWKADTGYSGQGSLILAVGNDSPAEQAGLQRGDVILEFKGKKINSRAQLFALVQKTNVGEKVMVKIWRKGTEQKIEVTMAEAKPEILEKLLPNYNDLLAKIGINVNKPKDGSPGLIVNQVGADSLAAGRLIVGDRILSINNQMISDVREFQRQLATSALIQKTTLQIIRRGVTGRLELPSLNEKK